MAAGTGVFRGEGAMKDYPIINKLLCVALVAALMFPLGQAIQPYVAHMIDNLEFGTIEVRKAWGA